MNYPAASTGVSIGKYKRPKGRGIKPLQALQRRVNLWRARPPQADKKPINFEPLDFQAH
jgi:hypothetical protein